MLFYNIIIRIFPLVSPVFAKSLDAYAAGKPLEDIFNDIPVGVYESLPLPTELRPLEPVRLEMRSTEVGHIVGLSVAGIKVGCPTRVRQYESGSLARVISSHDISNCYWFSYYVVKQAASIIKRRLGGTRDFDPDTVVLCTTTNSTKDDPHLTLFLHATRTYHGLVELNWPVHLRLKSDQHDHEHSMTSAKSPIKTAPLPMTMADANPPLRRRKRKTENVDGEPIVSRGVKRQVEVAPEDIFNDIPVGVYESLPLPTELRPLEPVRLEMRSTEVGHIVGLSVADINVGCLFRVTQYSRRYLAGMISSHDISKCYWFSHYIVQEVVSIIKRRLGGTRDFDPDQVVFCTTKNSTKDEPQLTLFLHAKRKNRTVYTKLDWPVPLRLKGAQHHYGHSTTSAKSPVKTAPLPLMMTDAKKRKAMDVGGKSIASPGVNKQVEAAPVAQRMETVDDEESPVPCDFTGQVGVAPVAQNMGAVIKEEPTVFLGMDNQVGVAPVAQNMAAVIKEEPTVFLGMDNQVGVAPVAQNMAAVIKEEPTVFLGMDKQVEIAPVAQNMAGGVAGCEEPPIPAGVYTPTTFPSGLGNLMFAKLEISYILTTPFAGISLFEPDKMHYEKCPFYEVPSEQLTDNLLHHHSIAKCYWFTRYCTKPVRDLISEQSALPRDDKVNEILLCTRSLASGVGGDLVLFLDAIWRNESVYEELKLPIHLTFSVGPSEYLQPWTYSTGLKDGYYIGTSAVLRIEIRENRKQYASFTSDEGPSTAGFAPLVKAKDYPTTGSYRLLRGALPSIRIYQVADDQLVVRGKDKEHIVFHVDPGLLQPPSS